MSYSALQSQILSSPRAWLVTGVAGFIASNLLEALLKLDQRVIGLDNLATGHRKNLEEVKSLVSSEQWSRFQFVEGDITNAAACAQVCKGVDFVLHQAALGSVPLSLAEPLATHAANVTGFLNMLNAAREAKVKRFVYASTCAIYGDSPELPKQETMVGRMLSPYAATKWMNEVYAATFAQVYGFESIGLRYFNVFGPRQDPEGAYAAVIPKWISALLKNGTPFVNGDGETSRDFVYVADVVQANLLAATGTNAAANQIFNVGQGTQTSLNELFSALKKSLGRENTKLDHREFRPGDVRHSVADISKARTLLGYEPQVTLSEGLSQAMDWYRRNL